MLWELRQQLCPVMGTPLGANQRHTQPRGDTRKSLLAVCL